MRNTSKKPRAKPGKAEEAGAVVWVRNLDVAGLKGGHSREGKNLLFLAVFRRWKELDLKTGRMGRGEGTGRGGKQGCHPGLPPERLSRRWQHLQRYLRRVEIQRRGT